MRTFADALTEIANLAGIQASAARLCQPFAQEGYCKCVAQVRPYPSTEAKKREFSGLTIMLTGLALIGLI